LLNEVEARKKELKELVSAYDQLNKHSLLTDSIRNQFRDLNQRAESIFSSSKLIENEVHFLELTIEYSDRADSIINKIRVLSATSAHRFISEEDSQCISAVVEEQQALLDELGVCDSELKKLNSDANRNLYDASESCKSNLFYSFHEKFKQAEEILRQCNQEELNRRNSLLQIKSSFEQSTNMQDVLNRTVETIEKILNSKQPSNSPKSNLDDYLIKFEECKKAIFLGKDLIAKLSNENISVDLRQDHERLEFKLDSYMSQIKSQMNAYELNNLKLKKLNESVEELGNKMLNLKERFKENQFTFNILIEEENSRKEEEGERIGFDLNESMKQEQLLEDEYNKARVDMQHIADLKNLLDLLENEKRNALDESNKRLSRAHMSALAEGFNELMRIFLFNDQAELQTRLSAYADELSNLNQSCSLKLAQLKRKLDERSLNKKKLKLNKLTSELDSHLDTLVNLRLFKESTPFNSKLNVDVDDEDLLIKESEDILLDKVSFDVSETSGDDQFVCEIPIDVEQQPKSKSVEGDAVFKSRDIAVKFKLDEYQIGDKSDDTMAKKIDLKIIKQSSQTTITDTFTTIESTCTKYSGDSTE
jgi:hypothetical protein